MRKISSFKSQKSRFLFDNIGFLFKTQTTKVKLVGVPRELKVYVLLQPPTVLTVRFAGRNKSRNLSAPSRTFLQDWAKNDSFTQHRRSALHARVWIESWKYDMSWLHPELCSDFPGTSKSVNAHRSAVTWHLQPLMCFCCCARWQRNNQLRATWKRVFPASFIVSKRIFSVNILSQHGKKKNK